MVIREVLGSVKAIKLGIDCLKGSGEWKRDSSFGFGDGERVLPPLFFSLRLHFLQPLIRLSPKTFPTSAFFLFSHF